MAKFFFFEYIVGLFYRHVFTAPKDTYSKPTQLGITFASGYLAGVVCAVVSHPADSVVSLMGKAEHKGKSIGQIASEVGIGTLATKGLGTRVIMIGTLTGQYDVCPGSRRKTMLMSPSRLPMVDLRHFQDHNGPWYHRWQVDVYYVDCLRDVGCRGCMSLAVRPSLTAYDLASAVGLCFPIYCRLIKDIPCFTSQCLSRAMPDRREQAIPSQQTLPLNKILGLDRICKETLKASLIT